MMQFIPPTTSDFSQGPQLEDVLLLRVYETHDQNIDTYVLMKLLRNYSILGCLVQTPI